MKKILYILISITVLSSCSEYQSVLKSEDIGEKFKFGNELFEAGKFAKANRIFAQIVPAYRGKPQAEKLMYLYSKSFFETKDYHLAAHQFDRFAASYPKSEKAEEALFLGAKSAFMLSPVYSKDQTETKDAIEKLQIFINDYPSSPYLAEANTLVKELDDKLERKSFEIAKQLNTIREYKASFKAFDNFVLEFPGSKYREDVMYYKLDSAYNLAINSVESKKQERLQNAYSIFQSFKSKYGESSYFGSAEKMNKNIQQQLEQYSTKS